MLDGGWLTGRFGACRPPAIGRAPLWYHAMKGDLAGIQAELAGGADPDHKNSYGRSPRQSGALRAKAVVALFPS